MNRPVASVTPSHFSTGVYTRIQVNGRSSLAGVRTTLERQFAVFIRKQRGERPYRDFARKLGISKSSLARLEMGEESITLKRLNLVLNRLKCQPADVFKSAAGE